MQIIILKEKRGRQFIPPGLKPPWYTQIYNRAARTRKLWNRKDDIKAILMLRQGKRVLGYISQILCLISILKYYLSPLYIPEFLEVLILSCLIQFYVYKLKMYIYILEDFFNNKLNILINKNRSNLV